MADADHPKTHVEDQDVKLPRKQPESPKHEGIDPLTESDTMYPAEDVKGNAEKLAKKNEADAEERLESGEPSEEEQAQADLVADQKAVDADTRSSVEKGADGEAQEPETDKGNTSPANKTTSKKS